jgi:hypothetical protein
VNSLMQERQQPLWQYRVIIFVSASTYKNDVASSRRHQGE